MLEFTGVGRTVQTADFSIDDQTLLISDIHFFHANIGRYCSRPDGWQDQIIENWNDLISPDEPVLHLGKITLIR
jgi:calcineurin-like phosphoesterase family protein